MKIQRRRRRGKGRRRRPSRPCGASEEVWAATGGRRRRRGTAAARGPSAVRHSISFPARGPCTFLECRPTFSQLRSKWPPSGRSRSAFGLEMGPQFGRIWAPHIPPKIAHLGHLRPDSVHNRPDFGPTSTYTSTNTCPAGVGPHPAQLRPPFGRLRPNAARTRPASTPQIPRGGGSVTDDEKSC